MGYSDTYQDQVGPLPVAVLSTVDNSVGLLDGANILPRPWRSKAQQIFSFLFCVRLQPYPTNLFRFTACNAHMRTLTL